MSKLWNLIDDRAVALGDMAATLGALLLAVTLASWLGGCAQIGQFTANDAQSATTVATAVGDSAGAACWPVLAKTGQAIAAAGNSAGLLTAIEEKRAVRIALQDTACQPVWAGVLAELLKATPAAAFVP